MRRGLRMAAAGGLAFAVFAATAPALRADWRDDHQVLRVGFLAASGAGYDALRLEPFRVYLESRLAMPVELVAATDYATLIDAQATDRTQYAIHSAASYVTAAAACGCIEPLALPSAFDGTPGFYAILLARADGTIASLADAGGARLAVAGQDSVAGRLVPLRLFADQGIDAATYFSAIVETDGPQAAIAALLTGAADLAVGWSSLSGDGTAGYSFGVLASLVRAGALSMDLVRIVWQSPLVPFGPHAVRSDLPVELKAGLVEALTAMAGQAPEALDAVDRSSIGGGGFVAVGADAYVVVERLLAEPGPAAGAAPPQGGVSPPPE
ncbi:MAG: phosphate/phosphite/phosphonate ABC transporter substrate-binding protein [Bauldia sp.]